MRKNSIVEIRIQDSTMLVMPSAKGLHRPKSAQQLAEEVATALDGSAEEALTELIVDLGKVSWIASAGLNELIRLQARARSAGIRLQLQSPSDTVRDIFRMTRLERTFDLDGSGEPDDDGSDPTASLNPPLAV